VLSFAVVNCKKGNLGEVKCLPSMHKALGSIPRTAKKKKTLE
jgi:hypothetical protein